MPANTSAPAKPQAGPRLIPARSFRDEWTPFQAIKDRIGRCKDGQTKVRRFLVPSAFLLTYREAASSAGVTACEG